MTLVKGIWYDNELNYKYGDHKFELLPNSNGVSIVKCSTCLESRMYLSLMNVALCKKIKPTWCFKIELELISFFIILKNQITAATYPDLHHTLMGFITVRNPSDVVIKTKQILKISPDSFDRETVLLGIKETRYNWPTLLFENRKGRFVLLMWIGGLRQLRFL